MPRAKRRARLKHGPIAVIDEEVPVIVLAPPMSCSPARSLSCRGSILARSGKPLVRPLPSRTACRYENVRAFG
jgi:glucosamine 6-phosphate synthetase-like amidotransferase/phosphosugar isomerase protein